MNPIFSGPLAQAIGWALLHLLWQGVLVAAILAAALALLQKRSANARYLASIGALVLIVVLSCVTAVRAYAPIRVSAQPGSAVTLATAPAVASASFAMSEPAPDRFAALVAFAGSHMPQIVLVWLIGVTLLSARLAIGWLTAHRLAARYAVEAEEHWRVAMEGIAASLRIRRSIRLLKSAAVEVPTVVGWIRPVVLLPIVTLSGLSTEQIEMILAHELAHIRRHDFIVNLLQSTVETLFFYQPAVWWISRRVRIEREHCCDDIAVAISGDPIRYARALTRFEELRIDRAQTLVAASGGSLVARIRRLVGVDGETARWSSRWTAGAALLTVVVALLVGPAFPMFAEKEKVPSTPPKKTEKAKAPKAKSEKPGATVEVTEIAPTPAPDVDIDVDSDDMDLDIDVDEPTPAPEIAAHAMTYVRPALAPMAPMIRASVESAVASATPIAIATVMGVDHDHKIDEKNLTVDDLIALRSAGVTPKYIDDMRGAGLGELTLNDLMAMRVQGVTPDYIRGLRDAGIEVSSARTAIELRVQGVTGDYIKGMRAAGYDKLSARDLIGMRVQGVTPRYVQAMADAGYKNLTPKELIELRVQGVGPDFVKSLADAGYTSLSVRDLVRLAASGVDAEFIRDLKKYRSKQ